MALRAGYYGIKRGLKAKLAEIAGAWDATVATIFTRVEESFYGSLNILPPFSNKSDAGITFTVDEDGVIDINGTATSDYVYDRENISLKKGTYTISGVPAGFGASKMLMLVYDGATEVARDSGSGATFTLTADKTVTVYIDVYQAYGLYNHVKVSPMLNLGTKVLPFVPYAKTNRELTASAADQKTTINAIISAATDATDFAAFKTAMGAITPVTRSLNKEASPEDVPEEVIEEKPITKKTTKKTVKEGE